MEKSIHALIHPPLIAQHNPLIIYQLTYPQVFNVISVSHPLVNFTRLSIYKMLQAFSM